MHDGYSVPVRIDHLVRPVVRVVLIGFLPSRRIRHPGKTDQVDPGVERLVGSAVYGLRNDMVPVPGVGYPGSAREGSPGETEPAVILEIVLDGGV